MLGPSSSSPEADGEEHQWTMPGRVPSKERSMSSAPSARATLATPGSTGVGISDDFKEQKFPSIRSIPDGSWQTKLDNSSEFGKMLGKIFQRLDLLGKEHVREVSELNDRIAHLTKTPQANDCPSDDVANHLPWMAKPLWAPEAASRTSVVSAVVTENGRDASFRGVVPGDSSQLPLFSHSASALASTGMFAPQLTPDSPSPRVYTAPPAGHILQVTIESCRGLRCADWGIGASSDPYVVCEIPDKPWSCCQTPVVERCLDPDWDFEDVISDYVMGEDLLFTVKDKDWGDTDDLLGRVRLPGEQFWPDGFEGELQLEEAGKGHKPVLTIKVNRFVAKDDAYGLLPNWLNFPSNFRQHTTNHSLSKVFSSIRSSRASNVSTASKAFDTFQDLSGRFPSRCILKPDASARLFWDILGIFVLLLDLIFIPMQVFEIDGILLVMVLYWCRLLYWTADIAFSFNTGYYSGDGKLVLRRKLVILHYLRGWCLFDIFLVTIDWAMVLQEFISNTTNDTGKNAGAARAGKLARIIRIVRLLRLMRLAKLRHLLFTLQGLIDSEWMTIGFVVGKNLGFILSLNHYLACLWFLVGKSQSSESGWVHRKGLEKDDWGEQYLVSLHWSLAQFTPGKSLIDPKTQGELAFSTAALVIVMVVATCFVSSITSALGQIWSMNRYTATQSFLLKKFLTQNRISRSLAARVSRYIEGVIELRHTQVHPSKVEYLGLLSGPLNVELHKEMRLPKLSFYPLFVHYNIINPAITGQVCTAAVLSTYFGKHDVLFKEGMDAESMYFLSVGCLAYCHSRGGQFIKTKLDSDRWCSEAALWMPWIHRGQMKAVAHADVTVLNAAKFIEISSQSEDVYKYARGCAFQFWNHFDPEEASDIPAYKKVETSHMDHSGHANAAALMRVREAEDAEIHLIHFD